MKKDGSIIDGFTMTKKSDVTHVEIGQEARRLVQYVLNYLNPFRPRQSNEALNFVFEISQVTPAQAAVYDLMGREVARLSNGEVLNPGRHVLQWNGRDAINAPAAMVAYFYRLQAEHKSLCTRGTSTITTIRRHGTLKSTTFSGPIFLTSRPSGALVAGTKT